MNKLIYEFGSRPEHRQQLDRLVRALKRLPPKVRKDVVENLNMAETSWNNKMKMVEARENSLKVDEKNFNERLVKLEKKESQVEELEKKVKEDAQFIELGKSVKMLIENLAKAQLSVWRTEYRPWPWM